jgi:MoaA/NifB/PqqE/SkfB family radical SAM enzyme
MKELTVLYRGPLSSCNYACAYCPFAKRRETRPQLEHDRACLRRFVAWAEAQGDWRLRLFFTPWGEALVRRSYREAIVALCGLPQVEKVVVQTNLSAPLNFASSCRGKLAVWATFHPDWADRERFLRQCGRLDQAGVAYSVGVVGFARFRQAILDLRQRLKPRVYLWINAVKAELDQLSEQDRHFFSHIDPLYELNTQAYPSRGRACGGGSKVISVDGEGTMRTCHFQPQPLGNLYRADWSVALQPRLCQSDTCRCHIGYAHLEYLRLDRVFGSGILERIPSGRALLQSEKIVV